MWGNPSAVLNQVASSIEATLLPLSGIFVSFHLVKLQILIFLFCLSYFFFLLLLQEQSSVTSSYILTGGGSLSWKLCNTAYTVHLVGIWDYICLPLPLRVYTSCLSVLTAVQNLSKALSSTGTENFSNRLLIIGSNYITSETSDF